jgi:hypothetical protein
MSGARKSYVAIRPNARIWRWREAKSQRPAMRESPMTDLAINSF